MNRSLLILLSTCLASFSLIAQSGGISGTVTSADGSPLSYATIFVKETGTGTTTNEAGKYEIRLQPGNYTLAFQFLGYETQARPVSIGSRFEQLNVSLSAQTLDLQEIEIVDGDENPAYTVMRKAIAKASYHRQQLDRYSAEVYIKGSGRLVKVPRLLRSTMEKEGIDSSFAFTSESVSLIEYERPNTFRERVISVYTQGDDRSTSPNAYINGSFYEPEIGEAVSPLSPRAFAYYRFEHEGYFIDRGYGINKIKVIPRSPGDGVFAGLIYIVEDWWSIYSLDLRTSQLGIQFDIDQVYAPIADKAWMPVSHQFEVEGQVLGFGFEFRYLATVSDYDIALNPDLGDDFTLIDEQLNRELAEELARSKPQRQAAEQRLSSGEAITRKDLRKLMREYEREERQADEEPAVIENQTYEVDSTAYKKDSLYWETIRPVPLTELEARGYERMDSMATAQAQADSSDADGLDLNLGFLGNLIGGKRYELGEHHSFAHASLLDKILFNPTEGFSLHTDLTYAYQPEKNRLALVLTPRYAFARERLTAKGQLGYSYGPKGQQHRTSVEGGRYLQRYNGDRPIGYFFNTFTNLFTGRNFIRLYEKDYLQLTHQHQLKENWSLSVGTEWARRYTLNNISNQVWINWDGRTYTSNRPVSTELGDNLPQQERAFVLSAELEARPWQKYRMYNGKRETIDNSSPTLRLSYRQGLEGVEGSDTDFAYLEAGVEHRVRFGARGRLDVRLDAGLFLSNEYVGFADYRHFSGNELNFTVAGPTGSYRLLPYYSFSTHDRFVSAFAHYQFRKLLITHIPEARMIGLKENLFANALSTPASGEYFEVGYGLDNVLRAFRVEVAFAFDNGGYRDWGVVIGIASSLAGGAIVID